MKKFLYLGILTICVSCQIEEDGTPTPTEGFIKYFGQIDAYTTYESGDIVALGDTMIVFSSALNVVSQNSDISIMLLTADGGFIDSVHYSYIDSIRVDTDGDNFPDSTVDVTNDGVKDVIEGNATAGHIAPIRSGPLEGGYIAVGTYLFNNSGLGISNVNVPFIAIYDASLQLLENNFIDGVFIIPNGSFQQPDNLLNAFGEDFIQTSDGSFIFGGSIEVDRGGGVTDFDFRIRKFQLNLSGIGPPLTTIWDEVIGIEGEGQDEFLCRIFEKENGNIMIIGTSSEESWLGENEGDNGTNVTWRELDADGNILDGRSYGIDFEDDRIVYNEFVNEAVQTSSGFAIVGTSTLSTDDNYAFFMNLTSTGGFFGGDTIPSSVNSSLQTNGRGIVQAADNSYIVLGDYESYSEGNNTNRRAGEALFVKVSQSGKPESETNYGSIDGNDRAIDGLLLDDNKILVLANMDFGGGVELVSLIKTNDNGEIQN